MKLKKGSKEAKAFMAKLRNARKGAVKKTIRKVKKATLKGAKHTDNKSHNYRISISGLSGKRQGLLTDLKNRYGYLSSQLLTAQKGGKSIITKEMRKIKGEILQMKKHI